MQTRVKICGLTRPEDVDASAKAGADYVGFCLYPPSPRYVTVESVRDLANRVPQGITRVALAVDPDDALIASLAESGVDMIQLHGSETPERARAIRDGAGLPVMKVIGVRTAADLAATERYVGAVDQLMVDAKPPKDARLPGGNGITFDWSLLDGHEFQLPWMLAGGLTPDNVAEAIRRTGAAQIDVASGVESAPGTKDARLIADFVANARSTGAD